MNRVWRLVARRTAAVSLATALVGAALFGAHAFAGSSTLTIGHVSLLPGEEKQMQLKASDIGAPGLGAWMIDIDYNASVLTPTSCIPGAGAVCNASYGPSTVRVVGADADGVRGDTTLATVSFRCNREGSSALALTPVEFADATTGAPRPIGIAVEHGSMSCVSPEPPPAQLTGDANCDGVINSIDALIVLQLVAGLRNAVPCPDLADYNGDGQITSIDAALILQDDAGLI